MKHKYEFSVILVASHLASVACGSSDKTVDDTEYAEWLEWRISDSCWSETVIKRMTEFDNSVRLMAKSAIELYKNGV